eukprot:4994827-Amphidinium_carterae.1
MTAVTQNGEALEHAADCYKHDREIVLAAVCQNEWALRLASDALLSDPTFAVEAKEQHYLLQSCCLARKTTFQKGRMHM